MMAPKNRKKPLTAASFLTQWGPYLVLGFFLLVLVLTSSAGGVVPIVIAIAAFPAIALTWRVCEARRWSGPIQHLATEVRTLAEDPRRPFELTQTFELSELLRSLRKWNKTCRGTLPAVPKSGDSNPCGSMSSSLVEEMTRSGMFASFPSATDSSDGGQTSEFSPNDMVCRLDAVSFRWLEASPGAQEFLGWNLDQLRRRSILEPVHPEDRERVEKQLYAALAKGEAHGLILRIKTARGVPKAIEMNLGVRYASDLSISHLRCHITDVTDRVRAERELRLRTRELTRLNEQLREINRELEDLKDRYRDLYQSAPAMYFSLDAEGRFIECNETLLRTLGYHRSALIGRSIERLIPENRRAAAAMKIAEFLRTGMIESEGQWVKASGELIDIWVTGSVVRGSDGRFIQSRSVAQDVTARHRLEAELQEKNERLAGTIEELSRRNKEMDEFTYVVSHDLQEPLRTLTAFSDFLLRDCGDRLDANGQEYVRYIVDASRRMRALIHELLKLSRAGKVTGDFGPVNLEEVVSVVRADLAELIRSKGAEIRVPSPLPTLWGDRARIGQLVANLASNGLKYNQSPNPWVEVGALPEKPDQETTIYVRDNGIGIDPQFHTKIFQLFRRLHTREEYEGTGAGLAICSKIVEAHKGKIWVESEPGQGATFYLSFRRPPQQASTSQAEVTHAP